ncbi:Hypothetical predicted protein [Marmota monax]|nr:Hypothetical predicted protein [Marmota monax]
MSTLLEIKSSVLRQVQVCPSFRRKTEQEPASTSADLQEPATGAWKPGDGVEFFAHMRLILKKGEGRQGLPCPEVRTPSCRGLGAAAPPSMGPLLPLPRPPQVSTLLSLLPLEYPCPVVVVDAGPACPQTITHAPLAGPLTQWLTSPS